MDLKRGVLYAWTNEIPTISGRGGTGNPEMGLFTGKYDDSTGFPVMACYDGGCWVVDPKRIELANITRYKTMKRTAIDGRVWWCVFDTQRGDWSKALGRHKLKREADTAIALHVWRKNIRSVTPSETTK